MPTIPTRVRMYCHGLGDCFLITFPSDDHARPVHVMIDCGILQRSEGEGPRLHAVAQNLFEDTDGKIDLLIVTHEHWDHIAGFSWASDVFEKFEFKNVWLSWAENLKDRDAKFLKEEIGKKKKSLKNAVAKSKTAKFGLDADPLGKRRELIESARKVLSFVDENNEDDDTPDPKKTKNLGEAMDWLREMVTPQNYCSPGEVREVPGTNVKAYVLGPPRDIAAIRKMNPSGDQGYRHIKNYSFGEAIDRENDAGVDDSPFDRMFFIPEHDAKLIPLFNNHYFGIEGDDENPLQPWRRIDGDWLAEGMARLALQLDVGVNNTSLAIAFELPDGRTMIFPGDAQIGNWMSWQKVEFKSDSGAKLGVTTNDLLARAVFYKVGHHGSHNATAKPDGLERMTGPDLVAMIPVDKATAKKQRPPKTGWAMPFDLLYEALEERTDGCIVQADDGLRTLKSQKAKVKGFKKALSDSGDIKVPGTDRALYVEYELM